MWGKAGSHSQELTLVMTESANEAGLSVGMKPGGPVAMRRNLAATSNTVELITIVSLRMRVFQLSFWQSEGHR